MDTSTYGTVTLESPGYVVVALEGDQTYQSIDSLFQIALKYAEQLKGEHRPLLGLVDLSHQTGFNTGSNKAALEALSKIDYDRAALVGDNALFSELAQLIIGALGKNDRTKFFKTREEAVPWLLMKDPLKG